jgi:hypothetical protein
MPLVYRHPCCLFACIHAPYEHVSAGKPGQAADYWSLSCVCLCVCIRMRLCSGLAEATQRRLEEAAKKKEEEEREKAAQK